MIDRQLLRFSMIAVFVSMQALTGCGGATGLGETATENRSDWHAAAVEGDLIAQYKLGSSYCCGHGQTRNTELAIAWLCRAAIQGHVEAQFDLAKIYVDKFMPRSRSTRNSNVPGVATNPDALDKAYMWYTVAAGQGHPRAFDDRQRVGKMMSKQRVKDSKRLAANWHEYSCPSTDTPGG